MEILSKNKKQPRAKGYGDAGASLFRRALKAFLAVSGSPNEDIDRHNSTMRQRGRMLYMGAPIATSAIKTIRTKSVGIGLEFKSKINRKLLNMSHEAAIEWQKKAEAEFRMWSSKKENCDALGINNFGDMQQLAMMSWLVSGDVFVLIKRCEPTRNNPYTLRLHIIEADRVSTPTEYMGGLMPVMNTDGVNTVNNNKIYDGVEVDKNGLIVAYHIRNTHPNPQSPDKAEWTRVEVFGKETGLPNILHIMSSERPEQYRGVTFLAQVIEPLLQMRRYTESELMSALIKSFFSAWVTTESDLTEMPIAEVGSGDVVGVPTSNPIDRSDNISDDPNEYEMGPGSVVHLGVGEDVKFGNPSMPSTGFDQFMSTMCKFVGAALEIPHDALVKEYNRSYSASRAAMLEMWEAVNMFRKWFVDDFPQQVSELFIAEAVAIGRLKAPGFFDDPLIRDAWCEARWIGPVQGHIDPAKEITAAIMANDHAYKTHEQVTYELGGVDWEENVEQLRRENELLKAAGGGSIMTSLQDDDSDTGGGDNDSEED